MNQVIHGDCLETLKTLEDNSIDSIVTDPPYGLSFMGKKWDYDVPNTEIWQECLRVLKPGGYLLAFAGTRTQHRMAVRIEDAGFEIRDMIAWVYASGFPKSLNIGKAVDKLQGNEREVIGKLSDINPRHATPRKTAVHNGGIKSETDGDLTKGTSEWEGWGTALKPAHEPVIVSMKPLQVEQIFAILIDNIWKHLPASDAINNLRDTQATLNEVVNSVPENVKINFLENIDNVEFVETLTTSLATKSKKEKESSAQENVVQFGEKLSQETKTHTGEVEDVSLVDISTSVQMGDISENIVLLWKNLSEELLNQTNTLTTRMATKKIIELKTLRSCLIQNTGISTGHSTKIPPNHEPICMARKPLAESTVALNVLKYGTGGINIDECRVETNDEMKVTKHPARTAMAPGGGNRNNGETIIIPSPLGRFPANLIHDGSEEVVELFPNTKSGKMKQHIEGGTFNVFSKQYPRDVETIGDSGSASRFFKQCNFSQEDLCLQNQSQNNVKCAEIDLDYQDKLTVQEPVRIKSLDFKNEELPASQDFTGNLENSSQTQNHVSNVENQENTDTTQITQNSTRSSGCVHLATEENTKQENLNFANGQVQGTRFLYQAKASKKERNKGLDGTLTVKYNECISNNKNLCKEENMVAVQLLRKVISEQELVSFSTGESGESIMVQCQSGSLSTILTETRRIIGLKIYSSLMLSLTSEYTQDANSEMESGGSLAENVADLRRWILTTTNGQMELALGASRVALRMLSMISEEENWKPATNFHSTVKPIALMEYLVKLVSREGATVLDPFAGSGTTGIACKNLNRQFIGIEREEEYVKIANARMANSL